MQVIRQYSIFYNNLIYILGFISLSLGFFKLNNYPFSIANFLVLFLFFQYLKFNKKNVLIVYFLLITYLIFMAVFFIQSLDLFEFIKSFLLTSIMLLVFISSLVKPFKSTVLNLKLIISCVGVLIVFFECIQIGEYLILGTSNSWFLLDKFSISTATDIGRFQAVNLLTFIRPISFYHEPSYLGIVLLFFLICANEIRVNRFIIYILYFGILASFSTTALSFLILYIFISYFEKIKSALFLISFVFVLLFFFIDSETLDSIFRFSEILNSGTSGNERLIGPYDYLVKQIFVKNHFFGIPLGQSELVFNNSFYLFFLYFGLLTPFVLLFFIVYLFSLYKFRSIKYLIAFFSLLFLNGAIFTLEATLLLYFLNLTFFSNRDSTLVNV